MFSIKKQKTMEILAGICFIIATVSYSFGSTIVENSFSGTVSSVETIAGMALELINSICVITIGICLYLRLKTSMGSLSNGYMVSRIIEAVLLSIGTFSAFLFGDSALSTHTLLLNIAMVVLGIYSACFFMKAAKLSIGPRWLFLLGSAGYAVLVIYSVWGIITGGQNQPMWLLAPGAVFEVIFPIWLIFKGFQKADA